MADTKWSEGKPDYQPFDNDLNEKYRDPHELSSYVRERILPDQDNYIFLDELQYVMSEEELKGQTKHIRVYSVLNGLMKYSNVDLYVTASNSRFLSKDVLSDFSGRGDEIHILPLSFREFMSVYEGDPYHGWQEYYTYGGLPLTLNMKTDEQKSAYLKNLMEATYLADILERHKIRNKQQLAELTDVMASSIGSYVSSNNISRTFQSTEHHTISKNTVNKYIGYLEEAFLLDKADRYDVKGRKYINSAHKYYFEDLGLRNARLNFRQAEETHIMENAVYNELRYRGYNTDAGSITVNEKKGNGSYVKIQKEIDFVASKSGQKIYIQCAKTLSDEKNGRKKSDQETASLKAVNDSFMKVVITEDNIKTAVDEKGIVYMNLYNFLLGEELIR